MPKCTPPAALTILAIAIEPDDLRRIQECLGAEAEVQRSATLADGLAWLGQAHAFSIVMDLEDNAAPISSLQQLQAAAPNARVILLSRLADEQMWIEALEAGAYDLLRKPLGGMEIASIVRGALLPAGAVFAA